MNIDELKEHCLKTLKHTEKFPTKTFEEHALVLQLIRNQTSVIKELEKIKAEIEAEIEKEFYLPDIVAEQNIRAGYLGALAIVDKRISELKGENK